jgi:hypothetical protein
MDCGYPRTEERIAALGLDIGSRDVLTGGSYKDKRIYIAKTKRYWGMERLRCESCWLEKDIMRLEIISFFYGVDSIVIILN